MTRTCAVTAHTRRLPDKPHVNDDLHRQLAREVETIQSWNLRNRLCAELEPELAVFVASEIEADRERG